MTLVEDIKEYFSDGNRWPGSIEDEIENVTLVEDEIVDTSRFSVQHMAIYLRKTISSKLSAPLMFDSEYVRVAYSEPSTENQEWESFERPDIEEVRPVEIKRTVYRPKE